MVRRSLRNVSKQTVELAVSQQSKAKPSIAKSRGIHSKSINISKDIKRVDLKFNESKDEILDDKKASNVIKSEVKAKEFIPFPGWNIVYEAIKQLRYSPGEYENAPVDSMEPQMDDSVRGSNFDVLLSLVISSQTRDIATVNTLTNVKKLKLSQWSLLHYPYPSKDDELYLKHLEKKKSQSLKIYSHDDKDHLGTQILYQILYSNQKSRYLRRISRYLILKECILLIKTYVSLQQKLDTLLETNNGNNIDYNELINSYQVSQINNSANLILTGKISSKNLQNDLEYLESYSNFEAAIYTARAKLLAKNIISNNDISKILLSGANIGESFLGSTKTKLSITQNGIIELFFISTFLEKYISSLNDKFKDLLEHDVDCFYLAINEKEELLEDYIYKDSSVNVLIGENKVLALSISKLQSLICHSLNSSVRNIIKTLSTKLNETSIDCYNIISSEYYIQNIYENMDVTRSTIPQTLPGLQQLPGVGPKIGLIYMGFLGNQVGIPVDRHVHRISHRLGMTPKRKTSNKSSKDMEPEDTRQCLEQVVPKQDWFVINPIMVGWGQIGPCKAIPECDKCPVKSLCPTGGGTKVKKGWNWSW